MTAFCAALRDTRLLPLTLIELAAAAAFGRERADILRALNRLSSLAYILMLQCKGDKSP